MRIVQKGRDSDPAGKSDSKEVPRRRYAEQNRRDARDYKQQPAHIAADVDLVHGDAWVPKIAFHDALHSFGIQLRASATKPAKRTQAPLRDFSSPRIRLISSSFSSCAKRSSMLAEDSSNNSVLALPIASCPMPFPRIPSKVAA